MKYKRGSLFRIPRPLLIFVAVFLIYIATTIFLFNSLGTREKGSKRDTLSKRRSEQFETNTYKRQVKKIKQEQNNTNDEQNTANLSNEKNNASVCTEEDILGYFKKTPNVFVNEDTVVEDEVTKKRRLSVKEAFKFAYENYEKFAFGDDELRPLSKKGFNSFGGYGLTILDSLDTMLIMRLDDYYSRARSWIQTQLIWDKESKRVSMFETIIRLLGGLLSVYDLTKDPLYLKKAEELGERLLSAFGQTALPKPSISLRESVFSMLCYCLLISIQSQHWLSPLVGRIYFTG
eukprot:TRINITY_DN667_c0_g2_i1.p2 TRINITY_DN667_c0_g2~~TRINITY_DN667_c0_g2_i1.p2  ORF type:complete len:290 (+),score=31.69 TRINITY_DN667_c0_g2_i1:31-900(+)